MRTFVVALLLPVLLAAGCKRKDTTPTPARDEQLPNARLQPQPQQPAPADNKKDVKSEPAETPNWIKKAPKDADPVEPKGDGLKKPWVPGAGQDADKDKPAVKPLPGTKPMVDLTQPPVIVPRPEHPKQPGENGANGGGKLDPTVKPPQPLVPNPGTPLGAAKKAVAMADMRDLQIFIDNASGASGRMPTGLEVYKALVAARSPTAKLVEDGTIVLTGATQREAVWAFEANALLNGGLVVSQNGVETLTADELKKRLGK
ncbi:MAG: hypothetical protein K2V38_19925 [Gemmataceae bacterium]|nr:hypothetical protein [Gemmataceae bacterium]